MNAAREGATTSRIRSHPPESGSPRRDRHHSGVGPTDPDEPDRNRQRRASRGLRRNSTEPPPPDHVQRGPDHVVRSRLAAPGCASRRCSCPCGEARGDRPVGASAQDLWRRREEGRPVSGRPSSSSAQRQAVIATVSSPRCHRCGVIGAVPPERSSAISRRRRHHRRHRRHRHHRSPWPQRTSP